MSVDSPWTRAAPTSWTRTYLGHVVNVCGGATPSKDEPEYWEGTIPWITPKDMKVFRLRDSEDHVSERALRETALRMIEPGSVLMVTRGMILDHTVPIAVLEGPAVINQDMKALQPQQDLSGDFLGWLLIGLNGALLARVEEAGHGTKALRTEQWRKLPIAVPPRRQQDAIAAFLDRRAWAIGEVIAKKERLLELLAEKRQAMITQAVTKGLDPGVAMKDSGVAVIGRMPAHWKVGALRRWCSIVDCKHRTANYVDVGLPVVSTTEVKPGRLNVSVSQRFVAQADFDDLIEGGRRPVRGDIIYSRNASLGAAAYVDTDEPFAMGQDVVLLRSRHLNSLFLSQVLNSSVGSRQVDLACVGATFKRINVADIGSILVPCPSVDEQANIADAIDAIDAKDAPALSAITTSITTLREYRQALITAAVTGQLDLSSDAPPPPDPTALEELATA